MTKFEEELKSLTSWDWINVDLIQRILTKFGNWHSDEEFKAEIKKLTNQLITRNDELISSNYEIESLKSQLISREKQVIELKEADKAQGKEIIQLKSQLQHQPLPEVPEFVAEAIESLPEYYTAIVAIQLIKEKIEKYRENNEDWVPVYKWLFDDINNQDVFALAFITGKYTVQKPKQKRYEVKLLSGESMHFNPIGNPKNIKDYRFSFGNHAGWKTKFTKSELAEIKDGMFYKILNQKSFTAPTSVAEDWIWSDELQAYEWENPFIELVPVEDAE